MGKKIKVRTTFVDSMGASEDGYSMLTALVSDAMTGYFKGRSGCESLCYSEPVVVFHSIIHHDSQPLAQNNTT
jgi:hypothetical protein